MKNAFRALFRFFTRAATFFVCFSFLLVLVLKWLPVSFTPLMFIRCGEQVAHGKKLRIEHEWIPFEKIPNHLQLAVVCCEDQNFLNHHGFDFASIRKAMAEAEEGGRHRGASTISQQTAKNVFLWPSSTWLRKGFEAWFTVLIETVWGKQRIMEVYLNSIEFGDGIYGCEAASRHFFHQPASRLSVSAAAALAIVLPDPLKMNVSRPDGYMLRREAWAKEQMSNWGDVLVYDDPPPKSRTGK